MIYVNGIPLTTPEYYLYISNFRYTQNYRNVYIMHVNDYASKVANQVK